jgi:hypothetical protein
MVKVTVAALLALSATKSVSAFSFSVGPAQRPAISTSLFGVKGAASSAEEDLMLTLKVIMDHAERSATASKDQYISQMEEQKKVEESKPEPIDVSIPYDAPARLAYEAAGSKGDYAAFKAQYEADAVADVIAKNAPAVDISVPYDAAARLAYEAAGSPGDFAAFKTKYEEDAVADVIAKNAPAAPAVDISVPYDAAAKLAYEAAGSTGDYAAFKEQYEAAAVADVIAKNAPAAAPAVDISVPYDAAAKLAYEAAGSPGDYAAFKEKYEADAVAAVIAKQKKPEPVSA